MKSGSIQVVSGSQTYDLQTLWGSVSESNKRMEIRRVYYEEISPVVRYFDPYGYRQGVTICWIHLVGVT